MPHFETTASESVTEPCSKSPGSIMLTRNCFRSFSTAVEGKRALILSLGHLPLEHQEEDYLEPETGKELKWESDQYFKRPRIEDDYYYSTSELQTSGRQSLGPRAGFKNESMQRDPGYVNFKSMPTPSDVLSKIRDMGTSLGESQVEAAFSRLKMFVPTPAQPVLDAMAALSLDKVRRMNLWQVCCMFQACSRMNYTNTDLLEALSKVVLAHDIPMKVDSRHLSNLFYAIGLLHRRRVGAGKVRFGDKPLAWPSQRLLIDAILAQMRSDNFVEDLTEHDAVSLLYGFGQLLLDGTNDIVDALYKHLHNPAHIAQLTEVQIMTLLNSFVHLGTRDFDLLHDLIDELLRSASLSLFREEELSTIVYSLGILRYSDPSVSTLLNKIFEEVVQPERLPEMTERSLVNLTYGVGQQRSLHGFDSSRFLPTLFEEVIQPRRLSKYTSQGLCNLIYTLGILRYGKGHIISALIEELGKPDRLKQTSSQGLTISLWGMAKAKHHDVSSIRTITSKMLEPGCLKGFTCNGISISMYSLGVIGLTNRSLASALITEASLPERIQGYGSQDRSNIAYAIGRWGKEVVDTKKASYLIKEFCSPHKLATSTQQHLINLLQCTVSLELKAHQQVRNLLDELSKQQRMSRFKPVEFAAVLLAVGKLPLIGYHPRLDILWKQGTKARWLARYTEGALSGIAYGMSICKVRSPEIMEAFVREVISPERLSAFNNIDLANISFSLIKCNYLEENCLLSLTTELCHPSRKAQLEASQVITALSGVTKITDQALSNKIMQPILELLKDKDVQNKFDCNRMCILLANLAFFNPLPESQGALCDLVEELAHRLKFGQEYLSVKHAGRMLISIGQLKMPSHASLHPVWDFLLAGDNITTVEEFMLPFVFTNIAKLSIPLQEKAKVLPAIVMELERRGTLDAMKSVELLQMVQHLSKLGPQARQAVDICVGHLSQPAKKSKLDNEQWARVMDISFDLEGL